MADLKLGSNVWRKGLQDRMVGIRRRLHSPQEYSWAFLLECWVLKGLACGLGLPDQGYHDHAVRCRIHQIVAAVQLLLGKAGNGQPVMLGKGSADAGCP